MSFHAQPFSQRFTTMGDPAEAAHDLVHPKHHKLGLNRPPFYMGGMEVTRRYVPDRMIREAFVECMGVGGDRWLKMKTEKLEALRAWKALGPVHLFVYDQRKDAYFEAPLDEWDRQLSTHGSPGTFKTDNKPYLALHVTNFPTDPKPVPRSPESDGS